MHIAVISLHTSPLDQPGRGDAGGMNVYVRSVWRHLAEAGFSADIFTRAKDDAPPGVFELYPGVRVVHLAAGARQALPKPELATVVPPFVSAMQRWIRQEKRRYDAIHAHYWLSGWVAQRAARALVAPVVASFHTLVRVKIEARSSTEPDAPQRARWETRLARGADRIVASTSIDAGQLVRLYGADPGRIRVLAPGVDTTVFHPGADTRHAAGLARARQRLILFAGRPADYKAPDVALAAFAAAVDREPRLMRNVVLGMIGGTENDPAIAPLSRMADRLGVGDRVRFVPAQPQPVLAGLYARAEALVMPSRSETFGLVAAEAMACGTPVIAANVGGLAAVVRDGVTGFLVEGHEPGDYAERLARLLSEPDRAARMSRAAAASVPSWAQTAEGLAGVYAELTRGGRAPA